MHQNFKHRFNKTRFAPSPTGFLHRGHVLSAAWVWGMASLCHAQVHLRMEDHDHSRCRESHVTAILADLEWLGFRWCSYSRQSQHPERYQQGLCTLEAAGFPLYGCSCTRQQLAESPVYSGVCRNRNLDQSPHAGNGLRLQLPGEQISWHDLRLGAFQESPAKQCGDILLRDKLGQWTYQYAVTLDDYQEGIDLVVRGEDLVDSTARQIQLGQMLGRTSPPQYLHHPLLYGADGEKLSKRQLSRSIASEREEGISPTRLLGEVCLAGKLLTEFREVQVEELSRLIVESTASLHQWERMG